MLGRELFNTVLPLSSDTHAEGELLDPTIVPSTGAAPSYNPTNSSQASLFSAPSPAFVISCLFDAVLKGVR